MGAPDIPISKTKRLVYAQPGYIYDDQIDRAVLNVAFNSASVDDFLKAVSGVHTSSFFTGCVDINGNIGASVSGRLPLRPRPIESRKPLDGSKKENDWLGLVPLKYHPRIKNPEKGYISHGNNKVTTENDRAGVGLSGKQLPRPDRI